MSVLDELLAQTNGLADVAVKNGALLLYVFGSCARRREGSLSDVDIAVLLDDQRTWTAPQREEALDEIGLAVAVLLDRPRDDIDIEDFEGMPPGGVFEVISTGRCLYEGEPHLRVCFERQALSIYQDFEPIERAFREVTHRRLREGTFGR